MVEVVEKIGLRWAAEAVVAVRYLLASLVVLVLRVGSLQPAPLPTQLVILATILELVALLVPVVARVLSLIGAALVVGQALMIVPLLLLGVLLDLVEALVVAEVPLVAQMQHLPLLMEENLIAEQPEVGALKAHLVLPLRPVLLVLPA
jgi:hypothetical protein